MGKNLRRKMFQEQKELERETGLWIGCCLFPAKRDLGRDIFNGAVFRKPKVLFCIYESLEQTASWIGCGDTVKTARRDFLKNLHEYRNAQEPCMLLCDTIGPQYLPIVFKG